ncbi:hypothetical protein KP509_39G025900 [Ceratopteris richardii]|uniref:UBA domain-containing protein n=1 Tax=Ceratopteris richardii TaxID=49495 RepID=A0A8T2PZN7_CERRI|nr:hypothetical protein KP509_39G025900 [Ceratopteris richardii]KAH7276900.1 hypothetical protein KP509_39G025900 [Ceratopteris richardii]KAH7276901.1 hypothetical protein KP509_39G025900 [Ceratopteris richardii]
MSPSKLKSNERQAARDKKAAARQAGGGVTSANAYNPVSGTFHALESIASDSGSGYLNGRFKSIDDGEDNSSSNGGAGELECASNNGSYSGESEDQSHINGKEKLGNGKAGGHAGVIGGFDKRDKVRGKNERKHQRQKERRAQELRDKCTSYLMSRKLEVLSQQLVAMGFPQERATMALIFNDGHVERSVAWLLEGGEGQVHEDWNSGGNPKIDITEELNYMTEIEKKYKFPRSDIERAIVATEGDLAKAVESLRARARSLSPDREEDHNMQNISNCVPAVRKEEPFASTPAAPPGPGPSQQIRSNVAQPSYQVRKDDRNFLQLTAKGRQPCVNAQAPQEILTRGSVHPRKISHPSSEMSNSLLWAHTQTGRTPVGAVKQQPSYTSQNMPVSKSHTGILFGIAGTESKVLPVAVRESNVSSTLKESTHTGQPHILLRANPQSFVGSSSRAPSPIPSSPAFSTSSRSQGFPDVGSPSSVLFMNASHPDTGTKEMIIRKKQMNVSDVSASDFNGYTNPLGSSQSDLLQWGYGPSNEYSVSSSLSTAVHPGSSSGSSFGLFTGWGSNFSHTSVDWSTGPSTNCDYRTIDWSMNASSTTLAGVSTRLNSLSLKEKSSLFWGSDKEWSMRSRLQSSNHVTDSTEWHAPWKVGPSAGSSVKENVSLNSGNASAHEWTSPFAGKDLFNLPQAVLSPSL